MSQAIIIDSHISQNQTMRSTDWTILKQIYTQANY
jgi:hypothetical protein